MTSIEPRLNEKIVKKTVSIPPLDMGGRAYFFFTSVDYMNTEEETKSLLNKKGNMKLTKLMGVNWYT